MKKQKKVLHSSKWSVKSSFPWINLPPIYIADKTPSIFKIPEFNPTFTLDRKRIQFKGKELKELNDEQLLDFQQTVDRLSDKSSEFKKFTKKYLLDTIGKEIEYRNKENKLYNSLISSIFI
tara:strand:+ start:842 stop:1204 length:363 start_codon:yes stop_codon:yes gene_type:complete